MKYSYTQIIATVFFILILWGGLLLCLPVSSKNGEWTSFIDALFTSTSALCVTGLVLYDTWTQWALFGQIIILLLMQTGGIGFMTIITVFSIFLKRKIGLHERQLLAQSAGAMKLGGVVRLIKRIVKIAFIIETVGAIVLAIRFCPQMGLTSGLWNAVFHSVSAFCSAGFSLMGQYEFSSLTNYVGDITVNITIILLIIIGGMGYIVLDDILIHKSKFNKYTLHSKLALSVTAILIFLGWILFYLFESNKLMEGFTSIDKVIASLFLSVNPRTSGFNTVDLTGLTGASIFLTIILMFIGGSPGSTAGGIKTTTFAILVLNSIHSFRKKHSMVVFKRRLDDRTTRRAAAIATIYMFVIIVATLVLSVSEPFGLKEIVFEVVSALGTVGLSLGITPALSTTGKIVIIALMFAGRVGLITLLLAFAKKRIEPPVERPVEKILIG